MSEPYADLFIAMLNQAKSDILFAPLDSEDFCTAAEWMLLGWGFKLILSIGEGAGNFRQHWIDVIESRRRDAAESRNNGRCTFSLS